MVQLHSGDAVYFITVIVKRGAEVSEVFLGWDLWSGCETYSLTLSFIRDTNCSNISAKCCLLFMRLSIQKCHDLH